MTPRTHAYIPDRTAGPDHRGDFPCLTCGLPRTNRRHQHVPVEDDVSARIGGDREEVGP